jgi:hypothetical protein
MIKKFNQYIKENKKSFNSITCEDIEDQFLRFKEIMNMYVGIEMHKDYILVRVFDNEERTEKELLAYLKSQEKEIESEFKNIKKRLESEFLVNIKIHKLRHYMFMSIHPPGFYTIPAEETFDSLDSLTEKIDIPLGHYTFAGLTGEEMDDYFLRLKELLGCKISFADATHNPYTLEHDMLKIKISRIFEPTSSFQEKAEVLEKLAKEIYHIKDIFENQFKVGVKIDYIYYKNSKPLSHAFRATSVGDEALYTMKFHDSKIYARTFPTFST